MDLKRNNLDKALSPYLQQHKENPIYWQEWSQEVLEYAKKEGKIILASVGYATCHWCHVMASEVFSSEDVAKVLNEHFVCIKIDREQRPDLDHYFMSFMMKTQGQGGWPLNVFLTPELKPFFAVTYVPLLSSYGLPSFIEVISTVLEHYKASSKEIPSFSLTVRRHHPIPETRLFELLHGAFDPVWGGFGQAPKFPPHCTLLFLLHCLEKSSAQELKPLVEKTLDFMMMRGLHDHLQGGFYRYSVDHSWMIPHFEKMLYDQAMFLWVYSVAYGLFKKEEYKVVAQKVMQCLSETFEEDGLYWSAHDADTDHEEGATYLWRMDEIRKVLSPEELNTFSEVYVLSDIGDLKGGAHVIKRKNMFLPELDKKLLEIRRQRPQPFIDKKMVTSWNAFVGVAYIYAYRFLGEKDALKKAELLFDRLLQKHFVNGKIAHCSLGSTLHEQEFLSDAAALLLFVTYLAEESEEYLEYIETFTPYVKKFQRRHWIESDPVDFKDILAPDYDHPIPSSVSLADFALFRAAVLQGKEYRMRHKYREPLHYDFLNMIVSMKQGNLYVVHSPQKIPWKNLPMSSVQVRSENIQACYEQQCFAFDSVKALLSALRGKHV